jgi:heptosyltransferase II
MEKTIIIRLRNWIGDVVLGIPALQALESAGYRPVLIGKRWAADLFAGYGWRTHQRVDGFFGAVTQYKHLREEIRTKEPAFDSQINALTFATSFSSALEMRLAGLNVCGYAYEGRSMLLAKSTSIQHGGHALVSYWNLVQHLLGTDLTAPAEIKFKVAEKFLASAHAVREKNGVHDGYVIVCPFAGGTFEKLDKRWPDFSKFIKQFTSQATSMGRQLVIVPGPGEEEVARNEYPQAVMLTGIGVGTYAALIQEAALVVSNDTGPAHIAAACGRPLVSVLGPTKPEQWAPWGASAKIIRRWPGWPDVEEIIQASHTFLARVGSKH